MSDRSVVLEITPLEATHLAGLVDQFADLLAASEDAEPTRDPAVLRLVPDAYEDADAAREFRDLTEGDLLSRRRSDAAAVLATLAPLVSGSDDQDDPDLLRQRPLALDAGEAGAWLRTLAALRLVLATRLGIADEADHDDADPRFGVYDWLGYRLEGLVQALDGA